MVTWQVLMLGGVIVVFVVGRGGGSGFGSVGCGSVGGSGSGGGGSAASYWSTLHQWKHSPTGSLLHSHLPLVKVYNIYFPSACFLY